MILCCVRQAFYQIRAYYYDILQPCERYIYVIGHLIYIASLNLG